MIKIVSVALVCSLLIVYLKSINSELVIFAMIMSGIIIVFLSLEYINIAINLFYQIIEICNIDVYFVKVVFKATAIGYLVEFGAGLIEDLGLKNLSDKLVFVGKILILSIALPIVYSLITLIIEFL